MALRLIVDERDGSTQISVRLPGHDDSTPFGSPQPFTSPLSIPDFEDLRFYLEVYASLPVGQYAVRGELVEQKRLSEWGEKLFGSIYGDEKRRQVYLRAKLAADGGEPVEVVIRSNNPRFLALPWELMKAPGERDPFSLRVGSFDRSLLITDPARQFASSADGFRVLMVIARPSGIKDVPFQAVARPLFQHLQTTDSAVRIDVLRPPSFDEFQQRLQAAKEAGTPYHAVHFDGHGGFGELIAGAGPQGYVVFEGKPDWRKQIGPKHVSAEEFSAALKAGGVPLVILNACRSGKIETAEQATGPEASVATRVLRDGAASVVAMSHSVYVVAAAAFMAVFYEALFAGKSVSEAVNAGRKALRQEENRLRPSLKGAMPLQDWMVPVHYARSILRLPKGELTRVAPAPPAEETAAKVLGAAKIDEGHTADDLAAIDGVFFGRDAEFFILERAIRTHGLAVIHGVGGTGKTELAKAFARWLQISGGLGDPRLVFFHSFEPGLPTFGLDLIVNEIMARFGQAEAYLAAGTTKERAELILQVLRQHRGLLIWDNFETVASMPEPGQATPPLDDAKKAELLWFIGELRKSKAALLITSRSEEAWLGGPEVFVRCELGGLSERDALQYADHLLAPHAQASARRAAEPNAFKELIDYLGGHPLSLKLILPRLAEASPSALLAGLKGQGALPPGFGEAEGRLASLGASLYYSFRHLPEEDQQQLVILSLFEKMASAAILGNMKDAPARFQGPNPEAWDALLHRLSDLGLLTGLGAGLYRLPPALPPYLSALWRSQAEIAGDGGAEREAALRSLINAAAEGADFLHGQIRAGKAQMALAQIAALRASLGAFLAAALERGLFEEAQALIQALDAYWDVAGLTSEAMAWGDRTINATEPNPGQAPEIGTTAFHLWKFVKGTEALYAERAGHLAKAGRMQREIAASFEGCNSKEASQSRAVAYHQLGAVAQKDGRLDEAEGWYKKSLAIKETLGEQPPMALSYHQLGMVAENRGRFDEAEHWYKKSLGIFEALGDRPHIASSCHQLGTVAQLRGRLDEAERYTMKSLAILEDLHDQRNMASSYGQLGNLAQDRGRPGEAEHWYKKSLAIFDVLDNQPGMATTCHQLGIVVQLRGRLAEAEGWYKKSLGVFVALGDQPHMALSFHELGRLAQARGSLDEAQGWYRKSLAISEALGIHPYMAKTLAQWCLLKAAQGDQGTALALAVKACVLFEEFPNNHSNAAVTLALFWQTLGQAAVAEAWQREAGQSLPQSVAATLTAMAAELAKRYGQSGSQRKPSLWGRVRRTFT